MPSPPGPPMTLGNMRSLGVRSLFVTCEHCHHEAVLSAECWGDAMLVREFRPRMICTRCGIVGRTRGRAPPRAEGFSRAKTRACPQLPDSQASNCVIHGGSA